MPTDDFITRLMTTWNSHDLERMVSFYAPDYEGTDVNQAEPHHGADGIRMTFERIIRGLPDVYFHLDQLITQDDQAVLVWTAEGTHQGYLVNIPPTGRKVSARGVSVLTIVDGKITKALYIWDVAGILRGIGLLPEL